MDPSIKGLHHITAITSDSAKAVKFYTGVLGLRLVKKTVNFDDPSAYHLYFADQNATPGTILTFFDWGKDVVSGQLGAGVTQHLGFTTRDADSLSSWKVWLGERGVDSLGPLDRRSFKSLYFRDPDGLLLEIATRGNGKGYDDSANPESLLSSWKPHARSLPSSSSSGSRQQKMLLEGLHHATVLSHDSTRESEFYTNVLHMELVEGSGEESGVQIFGLDEGRPGTMISFLNSPHTPPGTVGIGTVHHIAFAVDDEEQQLEWRRRLLSHGAKVTQVLDRKYFKSIYFREPNGVLLEIATIPPGFTVDESKDQLGSSLALPEWLEPRRGVIESSLKPLVVA